MFYDPFRSKNKQLFAVVIVSIVVLSGDLLPLSTYQVSFSKSKKDSGGSSGSQDSSTNDNTNGNNPSQQPSTDNSGQPSTG